MLLAVLPSISYQGFRSAPIPSGWVQMGERWALWWNGREVASVNSNRQGGYRLQMDALKMWQTKNVPVASIRQGKRFAECWCAARLLPGLRLREAVTLLTESAPIQPVQPLPGLPPTREQRLQAQRLEEAGEKEVERIKTVLEPRTRPAATKPRPEGRRRPR